jgi:hypothetical protein
MSRENVENVRRGIDAWNRATATSGLRPLPRCGVARPVASSQGCREREPPCNDLSPGVASR